MPRLGLLFSLLLSCAISAPAASAPASDPVAITLAQESIAALTGGATVTDVTVNANITSTLGSDNETGTGTLRAKGTTESRTDLNLSAGTLSEVRNILNGGPAGAWSHNGSAATAMAQHNAWIDAGWFFPPLSSLSQSANPQFIFRYIGQEQHDGLTVQHIRSYQLAPSVLSNSSIPGLSTMDFYLDPNSFLPLAIDFNLHADTNMGVNVPVEIRFANYQAVNGIQVPFHLQRLLNGSLVLDVMVTSVVLNTGLPDSLFTLQ